MFSCREINQAPNCASELHLHDNPEVGRMWVEGPLGGKKMS